MPIFLKLEEDPLLFSNAQLKTLNGYVITQGEIGDILSEVNSLVIEAIDKQWIESLLDAFGIRVDVAIERWIRSILGGGFGVKTALKLMLSGKSLLLTIIMALLKAVWNQVSTELIKMQINGVLKSAWEAVEERRLPH